MAQWRAISWNNHATRVKDLEYDLNHAIEIFRSTDSEEIKKRKLKSIKRFAEQLLASRVKMMKGRLEELRPPIEELAETKNKSDRLAEELEKSISEGLSGIYKEFGIMDIFEK